MGEVVRQILRGGSKLTWGLASLVQGIFQWAVNDGAAFEEPLGWA